MIKVASDSSFSIKSVVACILVVVIIPNSVMFIFSAYIEVSRPYVNFDYVAVALLFSVLGPILGAIGLLVALFLDLVSMVGQVLPFNRLSDAFYFLRYIEFAPAFYKLCAVVFFCFLVLMFFVYKKMFRIIGVNFLIVFNFLTLLFVFSLFEPASKNTVWRVKDQRPIASQAYFSYDSRQRLFFSFFDTKGQLFSDENYRGISSGWFDSEDELSDRLVLIVNESWGVTNNEQLNLEVMRPLLENVRNYEEFERGDSFFGGPTVKSEFRELCAREILHINVRSNTDAISDCLPQILRGKGYETLAVHGASGLMYDRAFWYPSVGFDQSLFFESRNWGGRCYSFPGACDYDIAEVVSDNLLSRDKLFLYWLTLNTHAIYDERDLRSDNFDCETWGIDLDSSACRYFKLQSQFFEVLSDLISEPGMAGVQFIVVGDHAPPISESKYREELFESGAVSWIKFRVR